MTHLIRTTMRPDVEVEVGDAEYLDLKRQGLIRNPLPAPAPPAAVAVLKKTPAPSATKKES